MKEETVKHDLIQIRTASSEDARELLEIYKPYVEKTAITFEYDVPNLQEFKARKLFLDSQPTILFYSIRNIGIIKISSHLSGILNPASALFR